jgi:cell shape-determining protein MreD
MTYLVSALSFILALMLQYGIVSQTSLLAGYADLILLVVASWGLHQRTRYFWVIILVMGAMVGAISAEPLLIPIVVYMSVYLAAIWIRERILQSALLAMFFLVFMGTLFQHLLYMVSLFISRTTFSWREAVFNILLPSLILNMLLAIPVHALIQELARTSQSKVNAI